MNTLGKNPVTIGREACTKRLWFDDDSLFCELQDGRVISVPLAWYPRLFNATPQQRNHYQIAVNGYGIHGPVLDEDLSVKGFLAGIC